MTGTLVVVAWSLFAFGAVYPWAYWPAAVGAVAVGSALLSQYPVTHAPVVRYLWPALAAVAAAIALQLLPLTRDLAAMMGPGRRFLLEHETALTDQGWIAASVVPALTLGALLWVLALGTLFIGLIVSTDGRAFRRLAVGILVLGCAAAFLALAQGRPRLIYGVWEPRYGVETYGPFVNRNHFATWMLMALSCSIGLFGARFENRRRAPLPGWQQRALWIASSEGCQLLLLAFAILTMALAVLMSTSRSGMISMVVLTLLTIAILIRRSASGVRASGIAAAGFAAILFVAVAWAGPATIVARFQSADSSVSSRLTAWGGALGIVRDFPVAGTGLGTFRLIFPRYHEETEEGSYLQTHNDYLQLASEGGLLVCLPTAWLLFRFASTLRSRLRTSAGADDYWLRALPAAGVVSVAVQETFEFGLQTPANAILFVVCCAMAVHEGTAA